MGFSRVLSQRPGIRTEFHKDSDGRIIINTVQDVHPILESNKKLANHNGKRVVKLDYAAPVARVPVLVQMEWIKKYGFNPVYAEDDTLLNRLLNDPEWRYLRTSEIIL